MEEAEGEDIESVSIVENLGIWSKIVEVKDKEPARKEELNKRNCQKRMEVSRLPAALL